MLWGQERVLHAVNSLGEIPVVYPDSMYFVIVHLEVLNLLVEYHQIEEHLGIFKILVNIQPELPYAFRRPKKHSIYVKLADATFHLFNQHPGRRFVLLAFLRIFSFRLLWDWLSRRGNVAHRCVIVFRFLLFRYYGLNRCHTISRPRSHYAKITLFDPIFPLKQFILPHFQSKHL